MLAVTCDLLSVRTWIEWWPFSDGWKYMTQDFRNLSPNTGRDISFRSKKLVVLQFFDHEDE